MKPRRYIVVAADYDVHPSTARAHEMCAAQPHGPGFRLLEIRSDRALSATLAGACIRELSREQAREEHRKLYPTTVHPDGRIEP